MSEINTGLTVKAGDWVRLRNGWIVGPLCRNVLSPEDYPVCCDSRNVRLSWKLNGQYHTVKEHELDIVAVVHPPLSSGIELQTKPSLKGDKPSRYHKQFQGVTLDLYRAAKLWGLVSHPLFHAVKKIMMAGERGHKDKATDLREAIVAIQEELKMMEEFENARKEI